MILEFLEISDDTIDEIVVKCLKNTLRSHKKLPDPDSGEIVMACKKLLELYDVNHKSNR